MLEGDSILNDSRLADFKKAIENGEYSFQGSKIIKELQSLHITRTVRLLNTDQVLENNRSVVDALINNQIARSRIVEIKMNASNLDIRIKARIDALTNYLLTTYADFLKKNYNTQTERKSVINSLFDFVNKTKSEIEVVQKFSDLIIDDIDKSCWSLKSIIDCLKINDAVIRNNI